MYPINLPFENISQSLFLTGTHQLRDGIKRAEGALNNLYLGGAFDAADEIAAIERVARDVPITVAQPNDMNLAVAKLLADGEIVACCRGRMEWGARALGNRSIVASAHNYARVDEINRMIKMRDFWMPFAPSIRAEAAARYLDDPKRLSPWFMTFAFQTKAEARADLSAGSHPRDHTIRPQVVTAEANPNYHEMISHFESQTGRGGVLNTSFNLHGYPIVYSPSEALDVFAKSGLMHVAFDHHIVSKAA